MVRKLSATVLAVALLAIFAVGIGQAPGISTSQIRDKAVTDAKLANMLAGTVKCNKTAGSASPSNCTASDLKTLLALAVPDVSGLQAALDGKLPLAGGTVTGTLTLNNGANSLKLTAGSQDHTYVEFYARTASPGVQSGYFGFPGAGSADLYFANSLSGGNIVLNTTGGGKLYTNGNTLLDSSDPRILYQGGLLSARPAAAAANSGLWYFASDIAGGTLYRSTGSAWQAVSPGLTQGLPQSLKASLPAPSAGNKGSVYFVSDENSGLGSLAYSDGATWQYPSVGEVALTGYTSLASALAVTTANKQRLVIPPGTYTLSSPVTLSDWSDVECMAGATFQPGTATNTVLLLQASRLRLKGCAVNTANQGSYSGIAVDVQGVTDSGDRYLFSVDGLYINSNGTQGGTCLRLFSGGSGATQRWISQTRWNNVSCRGFGTGVLLQTTGGLTGDYVNGNVFSGLNITNSVNQIKVDAAPDAEVSSNQFQGSNLQTGLSTSRSVTVSGKAIGNVFAVKTWDWGGANSAVSGRIAYEITGLGNAYTEPMFNRITDVGFGWDAANLAIAPRNYFETKGNTGSPLENQIALPGSNENRALIGDQDDILAGATYRYTVSTVAQSVAPTCRGGSLATLFAPRGKCTWNMPAGGSVTLRVDLNPDGLGYDYIDTIGAQYIGAGEQPTGVTIQTGDTTPALTTAFSTTTNVATYTLYQNIGLGGTLQVRYIDFTFSRATAGNLSVQRLFARGLIRQGPFWPQGGASGGVLWNRGGQLIASSPSGSAGQLLTSGGAGAAPTWTTTLPQANGGTGAAALTCTAGQALSSNGTAYSCTSALTANAYSGTLPIANGGTNTTATPTNGGLAYGTGSAYAFGAAGSAGQTVKSNGTGAYSWVDGLQMVKLTSAYTNATTTLTNTALSWGIATSARSGFECKVITSQSAATLGLNLAVTVPSGATVTYSLRWVSGAGTAPATGGTEAFVQTTTAATALGPTAGLTSNTLWTLEGVVVNSTTAGNVTVQGKASSAGTSTIAAGSYCQFYAL